MQTPAFNRLKPVRAALFGDELSRQWLAPPTRRGPDSRHRRAAARPRTRRRPAAARRPRPHRPRLELAKRQDLLPVTVPVPRDRSDVRRELQRPVLPHGPDGPVGGRRLPGRLLHRGGPRRHRRRLEAGGGRGDALRRGAPLDPADRADADPDGLGWQRHGRPHPDRDDRRPLPVAGRRRAGLQGHRPERAELFHVLSASRWQRFPMLRLPSATPYLFSAPRSRRRWPCSARCSPNGSTPSAAWASP